MDLDILAKALKNLKLGFHSFPDTLNENNKNETEDILLQVADKMKSSLPLFQPEYAGQMLKPPHAIARLAYTLAMYINANNHSCDTSRVSTWMEKEAVQNIAKMFGWQEYLGHLTSGGTMANMEALWVSKCYHPGKKILASELSHYTHKRISGVLGLPFDSIKCNLKGQIDIGDLEKKLKEGNIGTVVVTMGVTGTGSVDQLIKVLELRKKYNFRIHVDAAYGGYFILIENLNAEVKAQYRAIKHVDSLVIDPHKRGLQPYGCGCILFKDKKIAKFYKHDSPYTYYTDSDSHFGEITLECSRSGSSAVALWATMQMFPLKKGGRFANDLAKSRQATINLYYKIKTSNRFIALLEPETDIIVWAPFAKSLSQISKYSKAVFAKASQKGIHLALLEYPNHLLSPSWRNILQDQDQVTCLRACLIKPEHLDIVDKIWDVVNESLEEIIL